MSPDLIHLHDYWPSHQHMGDCHVCGHVQDHPAHKREGGIGMGKQGEIAMGKQDMITVEEMANAVEQTTAEAGAVGVDNGAENIQRASDLTASALRESYEECAKRALEVATENLERAKEDMTVAETFAEIVRSNGDAMAKYAEAGFDRAHTLATTFAAMKKVIQT